MKKVSVPKDAPETERKKKAKSFKEKKKNMQRLGGRGGLSLEAFANAKTKSNTYNPAIIKKQREFYKNAKYVSKYKKIVKQQGEQLEPSERARQREDVEEIEKTEKVDKKYKNQKNSARSLRELYERKREEEEKARMEREATITAKNEERQKAESRRKALREKMFKKTRSGQPVMKYRIEHILETLQGSKS